MNNETVKVPGVIQSFIAATNAHDGDAFINSFADDGIVNDVARTFKGRDAIKQWSDKEIIGDKVTLVADKVLEHYGELMLTALIDGNYDKTKAPDPLYLDYFFTVRDNKIVRLI